MANNIMVCSRYDLMKEERVQMVLLRAHDRVFFAVFVRTHNKLIHYYLFLSSSVVVRIESQGMHRRRARMRLA
jgi:hypothetical protein